MLYNALHCGYLLDQEVFARSDIIETSDKEVDLTMDPALPVTGHDQFLLEPKEIIYYPNQETCLDLDDILDHACPGGKFTTNNHPKELVESMPVHGTSFEDHEFI